MNDWHEHPPRQTLLLPALTASNTVVNIDLDQYTDIEGW
jgi:hypothetical protein